MTAWHPLDNPARAALLGPQAHLAERSGAVLRYPADIGPFIALPDDPGQGDWDDLAKLVGPGGVAATCRSCTRRPTTSMRSGCMNRSASGSGG